MLTRDQIKGIRDIKTEKVPVPEWAEPGTSLDEAFVWVSGLAGEERDDWEQSFLVRKGKRHDVNMKHSRARLVALSCRDAEFEGNPIFSEEDVLWLSKKSAKALDRIFTVAQRLSGISNEDLEDLEKNSARIPAGDSISG